MSETVLSGVLTMEWEDVVHGEVRCKTQRSSPHELYVLSRTPPIGSAFLLPDSWSSGALAYYEKRAGFRTRVSSGGSFALYALHSL
jgi:hypothetical protein